MAKKINKYIWLIGLIAIAIIAPVIVNWLMTQDSPMSSFQAVGDYRVWIPFWGSLIAGIITIVVLRQTIKSNRETTTKTLNMQAATVKYTVGRSELNRFRTLLSINQAAFNVMHINEVSTCISQDKFDDAIQLGIKRAANLNKIFKVFRTCFLESEQTQNEKDYITIGQKAISIFGDYIKECVTISLLMKKITSCEKNTKIDNKTRRKIIEDWLSMHNENAETDVLEKGTLSRLRSISNTDTYIDDIKQCCKHHAIKQRKMLDAENDLHNISLKLLKERADKLETLLVLE